MKKPGFWALTGVIVVIAVLLGLFLSRCGHLAKFGGGRESQPPETRTPSGAGQENANKPAVSNGENEPGGDVFEITEISKGEFRAVWVASVLNLDFPSRQGLSAAAMRREIDSIVSYTAQLGLSAVIFQVRPACDAFYQSDIFPWSQWLSGTQGLGIDEFDPLEYWIESCHAIGLELHAWLNPYRVIPTNLNSSDPETLAPDNPVRLRPELAVGWTDAGGNSGLFLDPGLPEARALVIDGIAEIIAKYDVDGIHIDDYFYPGTNFNDATSYEKYGNGMDLADWRRENVNLLIKGIRDVIRESNETTGKNVRWGAAPAGIWMNGSNDDRGVPGTNGQESYQASYADTRRWVLEGWVDYICPQIYWYIGFDIADFDAILGWWVELCHDSDVDLYIGHAAYREDQNDQPPHWKGEMSRQLELAATYEVVKGSVFFRFYSLAGPVGNSIRDYYTEKDGVSPRSPLVSLDTLSVGAPQDDTAISAAQNASVGFNITGTSDPAKPLFMNGQEITNRTVEGFFFVYAPLEVGENLFTFSQEGQVDVTRTITRNVAGPAPTPPTGPTVSGVAARTYARVTSGAAWVFPGNTTAGGSDWMMSRGQVDRIVSESSNGFVKLSCGMWISKDHVEISSDADFAENSLKGGVYKTGKSFDEIVWQSDVYAALSAKFDGSVLTVNFGMQGQAPEIDMPEDLSGTMFESYRSGKNGDTSFYAFTVSQETKFEGCYTEYENGEFRLILKKRASLAEGDKPLTGITIVLDPGHGGDENGAIGPMGYALPEKELNLTNALKLAERLTALGADVHVTRKEDRDVTLQERVDFNLQIKPDLFISLHVNSIAETSNATDVRGFTVWYQNPGSISFAQTVLDNMYNINLATNRLRKVNQASLFVCRPQWAPAVLLEASFIVNIDDFVWLIDPVKQDGMADAAVDAILEYFRLG